jgi:hypothetical protein
MVQLVGGALLAGLASLALETPHAHWTGSLIGAMAWNTVLMSVGGMALYNFILIHYGAGRAASCFFVVPGCRADRLDRARRDAVAAHRARPRGRDRRRRAGVVAIGARLAPV